ncbi:MAG: flagellar assembly protein FliX [Alphaproteobacteria bacterium]|nr:flagellar assembly protein FliX [Alphaproteobacteria bacterium]
MKIEGPGRTNATSNTKGKANVSSADGSFGSLITGGTQQARGAAATHSIASIDALLAAQAVEDPTERAARQRMQLRADNILTELDNMRIALLTGSLTVGHIIDIADVVASHREKIMDPRLHAVLDEIDLRAQIEIAKLCKALDNPQ